MGTISSGIGLISGLPIEDIVNQLMAIEARPRDLVVGQINEVDGQKAAWLDLQARLLALKSAASTFDDVATFQAVAATSSDTSLMTASAEAGAAEGNYSFTPARLMTNHQVISSGRPDSDTTAVGAGTLTIEFGHGLLDPATALDFLNGQAGVQRGSIQITDRSGASATIDLTTAMTLREVIEAVNDSGAVSVTASVSGDSIVLTDTSGSTSQDLTVQEVEGGTTAADLGIAGTGSGNVLTGSDVLSVNANTALAQLSDGNGIRTVAGNDLSITLEDATVLLIDLSSATTVDDVLDAINDHVDNGGKLTAALDGSGDRIVLTDTTGGGGTLTVAAVGASRAAFDLGILGDDGDADHTMTGGRLVGGLNTVLLRNLNGTTGVTAGSIEITSAGGGPVTVDLSAAESVQDVIDAINDAGVSGVTASLNAAGNGILLTDSGGGPLTVDDVSGTMAEQLNIKTTGSDGAIGSGNLQHRYISENTTLEELGVARGSFVITDSSGATATVDLTQGNEVTLADVISEINTRPIGVTASINANGDGLLLTDTAGGGGTLTVAEQGSTTAADLGIKGSDDDADQMINGSLELNINVEADDTLEDLADAISAASTRVSAFIINDGTTTDPYRLAVTSRVGGTAGRMVIDTGDVGVSFADMIEPQDALLFLGDPDNANAIAIRSTANSFANVIDGVTLNLVGTSDTPVNVSITTNIDAVVTRVNAFVTSFNDTIERIDVLTDFDLENNTRGVLQADNVVSRIRSSLFSMVTSSVSGAPGEYTRLSQVGFSVTGNGTEIAFDEEKFRQAFADNAPAVIGLFTLADNGIGDRIDSKLDGLTDNFTGTIQLRLNGLEDRRDLLSDRVESLDSLLASKRARLLRQFNVMERVLAQMQSQMNALSGLGSNVQLASGLSGGSSLF